MSRDRRVPVRKRKVYSSQDSWQREGEISGEGAGGRQWTGPEHNRREESGQEYILAFCYSGGRLGMSQRWDWHSNLVQYARGERGYFAPGRDL